MSESGWTPGAAEPPTEREDVRPLSHHDSDAHAEGASRPEPAGQDGAAAHVETETESEAKARARSFFAPRGPASAARLNREARFGIAALLSFLILVTVLIVNKGKSHARGEKIPSVAKTDNPQAPPARPAPAPSRAETESPRPGPGPKGTEHAGAPRRAGLPPAPAPIPPPPVMPQPAPLINLGAKPAAGPDEPLHLTEGQGDSVPTPDTTAPDKAVPVVALPAAVPPSEGSKGPKSERTEGPKSEGAPSPAPQPLPMPLAPAEATATPMLPPQATVPTPGRMPLDPAPAAPNPVPAPTPPAPVPVAAPAPAPAAPSSSAPGSNPPAPTPAAESLASTAGAPEAEKLARPEEGPAKPEERPSEPPSPAPPSEPAGPKGKGKEKSADPPSPAPLNEPVVPKEKPNEQPSPPPERPSEPVAPKEEEAPSTGPPPAAAASEATTAPTPQPKPEELDRSLIVPNSSSFSSEPSPRAGGPPASAPTPRTLQPPREISTPARAPSPARSEEITNFARPPAAPEPSGGKPVAADAAAGLGVATGAAIPNAGKRRALGGDPATRDVTDNAPLARPAPAASDDPDQVESVPHVVQSGENFWTISRLYYGSGRYYLALWKANSRLVPAPERLRVGMTIRIPPPEALDRSLIQPPQSMPATGSESGSGKIYRRTSRPVLQEDRQAPTAPRRPSEIELALPVADPFSEPASASEAPAVSDPDAVPETRFPPRHPIYKVRKHETLRGIARDTLGDSRRAGEILELNRDIIDDPNVLTEGQIIELPDDARIGHRGR